MTDEYLASSFVEFVREDPGYRPYRRFVGSSRANSGSHVVDIGADVCTMEAESPEHCEFTGAGAQGRLSRIATSVTVFAGIFGPLFTRQVTARLIGLGADGSEVSTEVRCHRARRCRSTRPTSEVTVTSPTGDIAEFRLNAEGPGATGGSALGFDDLRLTFPDDSPADVALTVGGGGTELLQGRTLDVPVTATRINGSNGPLVLAVSGLPPGVSASFTSNPLTGTDQDAVLRLSATSTAERSSSTLTVTADPPGNTDVAPEVRVATTGLQVNSNFELLPLEPGPALLPHCARSSTRCRYPGAGASPTSSPSPQRTFRRGSPPTSSRAKSSARRVPSSAVPVCA